MSEITIKEIAVMANVSPATVSRAINGDKGVSEKVRAEILELCRQNGYRVNTIARSMVKKRTHSIGMIIPNVMNPFYAEIVFHLESYSRSHGYMTLLCNSLYDDDQVESLFDFLIARRVDGIIVASTRDAACRWAEKYDRRVPTTYIGENPGTFSGNFVNTDNIRGGALGCEYLYGLGHRDILYLGKRRASSAHHRRFEGFRKCAESLGLTIQVMENASGNSSIESGYRLGKELFREKLTSTAIFAATDTIALGVMQAAGEAGIRIPADVSLLGFDNITLARLPNIQLTTIAQPKEQIATAAFDILRESIRSQNDGNYSTRSLKPTLVERNTCLKIHEGETIRA